MHESNGRACHVPSACCLVMLIVWLLDPIDHELGSKSYAEVYVAGHLSGTIPEPFGNVRGTNGGAETRFSDIPLKVALGGGGRIGWMTPLHWLGFEAGFTYTTPHLKRQQLTVTGSGPRPPGFTEQFEGAHFKMAMIPVAVMLSYPHEKIQPYIGGGIGPVWGELTTVDGQKGVSRVTLGVHAMGGMRVFLTKQVAAFSEYSYMRTRFDFDFGSSAGLSAVCGTHQVGIGLSFHFF